VSAKVSVICASTGRNYQTPRNQAERKVRRGGFYWVDNFSIAEIVMTAAEAEVSEIRAAYYDGPMGRGNVLPFTRITKYPLKPPSLHYPIPACGAHGRFLNVAVTNQELAPA
jgi:hypothetical protein